MKGDNARVGLRQWRILLAALDSPHGFVSGKAVREAIGDDLQAGHAKVALSGLLKRGLMSHACPGNCPGMGSTCVFKITERGEDAKLGGQGGWHGGVRPVMAPIKP